MTFFHSNLLTLQIIDEVPDVHFILKWRRVFFDILYRISVIICEKCFHDEHVCGQNPEFQIIRIYRCVALDRYAVVTTKSPSLIELPISEIAAKSERLTHRTVCTKSGLMSATLFCTKIAFLIEGKFLGIKKSDCLARYSMGKE